MVLIESIVISPEFLSAEPLANNVVAVTTKGEVDLSAVKVALNGSVCIGISAIGVFSDGF
jgi:phosphatidylinositol glycan class B